MFYPIIYAVFILFVMGRVILILDCSIPFVNCIFIYLLNCYHIVYVIIFFWLVSVIGHQNSFFMTTLCLSLLLPLFLPLSVYLISVSNAGVGKTYMHEFPILYGYTKWYLILSFFESNE